jgi:hypothetical protein
MRKSILKTFGAVFALLLFVSVMSSCNKGYGCPGELTIPTNIVKIF